MKSSVPLAFPVPSGTSHLWPFLTSVFVTLNTILVVHFWIFNSK